MIRLKNEHLPKASATGLSRHARARFEAGKGLDVRPHPHIALAAMALGKHVYVQKPLAWSIDEARQLARRAKETKVATQMGNQGHSSNDGRATVEYIQAGALGEVREVADPQRLGHQVRRERRAGQRPSVLDGRGPQRASQRRGSITPFPTSYLGIFFSASARKSTITPSITRSTGADGRIGASAPSAIWAHI